MVPRDRLAPSGLRRSPTSQEANSAPPMVRSRCDLCLSCRIASGSNACSIRVRALETVSSVPEYTILSGPPDLREVLDLGGLIDALVRDLLEDHLLVHPAPVKVGSDRPLEVVDERKHLGSFGAAQSKLPCSSSTYPSTEAIAE